MTLAKSIRLAFPVFLSCSLIACGGGSGFSAAETASTDTTTTDTTTTTTSQNPDVSSTPVVVDVKSLSLSASSSQLDSDGKTPVIITASAKDANNVLLDGVDLSISVDNDASVSLFEGDVTKTASLTPNLYDNRLLTVTVKAEGITETIQVAVVGTTLSFEGTEKMRLNTPTDYKILVRDSGGSPIGNQDIPLPTIVSGACVIETSGENKLNSSGEFNFQLSSTENGKCTLESSAFGFSSTFGASSIFEIEVSDFDLTLSSNTTSANDGGTDDAILEVPINKNEIINLVLTNKNNPEANAEVLVRTTRGTLIDKVVTDANGKASFTIRSADLGAAIITATFNEITTELNNIEFVAPEVSNVSTLRLSTSSFQLESDGKIPVTISALAKDVNNVLLDNPAISITVDNEADVTAFNGEAIKTATLTPGLYDNRLLTVTATAGSVTETIQVEVLGTTLTLDGPQRMSLDTPTEYKILVRDSGNNPIGNQPITAPIISGFCNITEPTSGQQLNSAGEYVFQVSATQGGTCTLSASDFGSSSTLDIEVSGDEFTITSSTDKADDVVNGDDAILEVPVNTNETINLLLKKNDETVSNATVSLSSTRGVITHEVVTNAAGEASFTIQSANSGDAVITASTNGLTAVLKGLEFVATTPFYINTQASPSIVTPLGKSIITTRIRDANDNPVKNKNITFNLSDTVGGTLNNSEAKTDSLGRASIEYTAGNTTSALDDVVITSTVQGTTTMTDIVKLTVGGNALRVVLGTDNQLSKSGVSYNQTFVVMVTDSAGNPIKDQDVNVAIVPTHYYKGYMEVIGESWSPVTEVIPATDPVTFNGRHECETEDLNNNGRLDSGEDIDTDNKLEPTHDASVAAVDASGKTGDDGTLLVKVSYPQSRALWSRQELVVRISSNGTEYEERTTFDLNILASDVSDKIIAPPNKTSPYGVKADCNSAD